MKFFRKKTLDLINDTLYNITIERDNACIVVMQLLAGIDSGKPFDTAKLDLAKASVFQDGLRITQVVDDSNPDHKMSNFREIYQYFKEHPSFTLNSEDKTGGGGYV
jgi:hypothetical protein